MLSLLDNTGEFIVYGDASHRGLGCVLMQHGKVIVYTSRQLQEKLSYARSGISSGGFRFENLDTLFIW